MPGVWSGITHDVEKRDVNCVGWGVRIRVRVRVDILKTSIR